MKKIISLKVFLLLTITVFAQSGWINLSTFPGTPRAGACGFKIRDDIYIGLGTNIDTLSPGFLSYLNDFWKYSIGNDSWSQIDSLPTNIVYSDSRGLSAHNKGYVLGGRQDSLGTLGTSNKVWEYNPISGIWILKNTMPFTTGFNIAFELQNELYVNNPNYFNNAFFKFDTLNNIWVAINDTIGSNTLYEYKSCSVTTDDHNAYIYGGEDQTVSQCLWLDKIYSYNSNAQSWSFVSPQLNLFTCYSNGFLFLFDSTFYFGNGTDDPGGWWSLGNKFDNVYSYNKYTSIIDTLNNFPFGASSGFNYFTVNNCGYLFCGAGGMNGNRVVKFCADSITGINEINQYVNYIIYPNPIHDKFKLYCNNPISSIKVYSAAFVLVKTILLPNVTNPEVMMNEFSNGLYFIEVVSGTDRKAIFKKIIKL